MHTMRTRPGAHPPAKDFRSSQDPHSSPVRPDGGRQDMGFLLRTGAPPQPAFPADLIVPPHRGAVITAAAWPAPMVPVEPPLPEAEPPLSRQERRARERQRGAARHPVARQAQISAQIPPQVQPQVLPQPPTSPETAAARPGQHATQAMPAAPAAPASPMESVPPLDPARPAAPAAAIDPATRAAQSAPLAPAPTAPGLPHQVPRTLPTIPPVRPEPLAQPVLATPETPAADEHQPPPVVDIFAEIETVLAAGRAAAETRQDIVPLPSGRALALRRKGLVDVVADVLRDSGLRLARWSARRRRAQDTEARLRKAQAKLAAMEAQLEALHALQQRVRQSG